MVIEYKTINWNIICILTVGIALRIILGVYNAPNNTFDDYLEPIAYYVNNEHRPNPAACWECYQPPLYFYLSETIYKAAFITTSSYFYAWKSVQFLNVLLSIGTLLIISRILFKLFPKENNAILIVLSIVCIYPRDIYTSAMITNDPLLLLTVTLSVFFFISYFKNKLRSNLILLCLSVLAAAFTKQHGLITMLFLAAVSVHYIYNNRLNVRQAIFKAPVLLPFITIILCFGDELWKYNMTNLVLVSNQHFFDYTSSQLPGNLEKIEFFTFRFIDLLSNPLLSTNTVYSYWTVLFASAWFDYEWRYVAQNLPFVKDLATTMYSLGVIILGFGLLGIIKSGTKIKHINFPISVLLIVGCCFLFVPLLQTLRFPYYSSMKSLFVLPGLSIAAIFILYCLKGYSVLRSRLFTSVIVSLILIIGSLHIMLIVYNLDLALPNLSGPLWKFPNISL